MILNINLFQLMLIGKVGGYMDWMDRWMDGWMDGLDDGWAG